MDRALADRIRQLGGHGSEVLTGGEQHDTPTGAGVDMVCGERLDQHHRRAGVDPPGRVELVFGHVFESLHRAAGVVDHDDVERSEAVLRQLDELSGAPASPRSHSTMDRLTSRSELARQELQTIRVLAPLAERRRAQPRPGRTPQRPPSRSRRAIAKPMPARRLTPVTNAVRPAKDDAITPQCREPRDRASPAVRDRGARAGRCRRMAGLDADGASSVHGALIR